MPVQNNDRPKILFVINPISGGRDKSGFRAKIAGKQDEWNFRALFYETTGANDEAKVREQISEQEPDRVVSVGGDGTFKLVASCALDRKLPVGLIPGGSANGMAYELQIPDDFEQALHIAVTGVPKAIDALRINDGHLSLHLADVGLNAAVIERFEQENVRGLWGYVRQYMRVLFRVRPIRFRLQVDGRLIRRYAYMAVIANATSYGTGAKINPGGKIDDGRFELILLRPYSLWHLLQLIIASFLGRLTDLESVEAYSCRKLEIENSRKHVVQVDGEIIGQLQEIRVEILPQALRVITAN